MQPGQNWGCCGGRMHFGSCSAQLHNYLLCVCLAMLAWVFHPQPLLPWLLIILLHCHHQTAQPAVTAQCFGALPVTTLRALNLTLQCRIVGGAAAQAVSPHWQACFLPLLPRSGSRLSMPPPPNLRCGCDNRGAPFILTLARIKYFDSINSLQSMNNCWPCWGDGKSEAYGGVLGFYVKTLDGARLRHAQKPQIERLLCFPPFPHDYLRDFLSHSR